MGLYNFGMGETMGKSSHDSTTFSGTERPTVQWIELPDELARWADKNQELIARIQKSLAETYISLSDEDLCQMIAASTALQWREEKTDLCSVEAEWTDNPAAIPLHLVKNLPHQATEGFTTRTLALFTLISEGLHEREDLAKLLCVLQVQRRMIERSTAQTDHLQKATADLDSTVEPLKTAFVPSSPKT